MKTNKQIVIFSKYFGYAVGGAEKSVFNILLNKEREGYEIHVVFVEGITTFGADKFKMELPETWKIDSIRFHTDTIRFRYVNYFINKGIIKKYFKEISVDYILYSYGFYAPAAINAHKGSTVYLVRDEYGLGWDKNYYDGLKRLAKLFNQVIEYAWYSLWKRDLIKAVEKSKTIANSHFIAKELKGIGAKEVKIILPNVDGEKLRTDYESAVEPEHSGIVSIGDNRIKGADIVRKIAARIPSKKFLIFDRKYDRIIRKENIIYMPWRKNIAEVYKMAELVLIPSRWHEAYPRVIVEAQTLGIPVIASSKGGIPEVIQDKRSLVEDFENIASWCEKIEIMLKK